MQQTVDVDKLRKTLVAERNDSLKGCIGLIPLALYTGNHWVWIPVALEIGFSVACQMILHTFCPRPKPPIRHEEI